MHVPTPSSHRGRDTLQGTLMVRIRAASRGREGSRMGGAMVLEVDSTFGCLFAASKVARYPKPDLAHRGHDCAPPGQGWSARAVLVKWAGAPVTGWAGATFGWIGVERDLQDDGQLSKSGLPRPLPMLSTFCPARGHASAETSWDCLRATRGLAGHRLRCGGARGTVGIAGSSRAKPR